MGGRERSYIVMLPWDDDSDDNDNHSSLLLQNSHFQCRKQNCEMTLFHCKSNMFDSSVLFEETVGPKYWILSHNLAGGRKKKPSLLKQTIAIWFHVKTKQLWFPLLLRPILEILWKFELTQAAPLISHMKREENDQRHGKLLHQCHQLWIEPRLG